MVWSYCADTMLAWTGVTLVGLLSAFRTSPSGGTVAYVPTVTIVTAGTIVVAVALPLTWNQVWRHGNTSMGIQVWEWESSTDKDIYAQNTEIQQNGRMRYGNGTHQHRTEHQHSHVCRYTLQVRCRILHHQLVTQTHTVTTLPHLLVNGQLVIPYSQHPVLGWHSSQFLPLHPSRHRHCPGRLQWPPTA